MRRMLAAAGMLTAAECDAILAGLERIGGEIEAGEFAFRTELEDIHLNIEQRLTDLIGEPGRRLHTARSRNDQVATDFKLWVRDAIDRADARLMELQRVLLGLARRARRHGDAGLHPSAGGPAGDLRPSSAGLCRDAGPRPLALRRCAAAARTSARWAPRRSPAPASRSTGPMTAAELGFDRPAANSIDAVSDRDFALDYLAAAAICAVHLSRFAEELVLWSTPQFGFVRMPEAFTSGSSIMPQKRNPDAAELVRGKSGRILGDLQALLVVLKGLPLAYSKDMQEDKEGVFDAADSLELCLAAMAAMLAGIAVDEARLRAAAGVGYTTATDLADWLVRGQGRAVPRGARGIGAGRAAGRGARAAGWTELTLAELQADRPADRGRGA